MAPAFHSMMENFDSKKATLKYDRAKFETESRTVLPLLITNEKFAYVTFTHKQNNETFRTGKGKYFTLGRCSKRSRIKETYIYVSRLIEPIYR